MLLGHRLSFLQAAVVVFTLLGAGRYGTAVTSLKPVRPGDGHGKKFFPYTHRARLGLAAWLRRRCDDVFGATCVSWNPASQQGL